MLHGCRQLRRAARAACTGLIEPVAPAGKWRKTRNQAIGIDYWILGYTEMKSQRAAEDGPNRQDQLGLERLVLFSDAVLAIAITLLALEIRLPVSDKLLGDDQLFAQLTGMWHEYLAYFISFMVIGTFWMAHHRKYGYIKRYDNRLMLLNLLLLMVIAFIPFPSSVLSRYSSRPATIFYALTMLLAGVLLTLMWWYASWNGRLIDSGLDKKQIRGQFIMPLTMVGVFVISIGIAFFHADVAKMSWLLIVPASLYSRR